MGSYIALKNHLSPNFTNVDLVINTSSAKDLFKNVKSNLLKIGSIYYTNVTLNQSKKLEQKFGLAELIEIQ